MMGLIMFFISIFTFFSLQKLILIVVLHPDYSSAFFRSDLLYDITSLIVMRTRGCYCSHVVFFMLVGAKVVFSRVGHFCANSSAQLSR